MSQFVDNPMKFMRRLERVGPVAVGTNSHPSGTLPQPSVSNVQLSIFDPLEAEKVGPGGTLFIVM